VRCKKTLTEQSAKSWRATRPSGTPNTPKPPCITRCEDKEEGGGGGGLEAILCGVCEREREPSFKFQGKPSKFDYVCVLAVHEASFIRLINFDCAFFIFFSSLQGNSCNFDGVSVDADGVLVFCISAFISLIYTLRTSICYAALMLFFKHCSSWRLISPTLRTRSPPSSLNPSRRCCTCATPTGLPVSSSWGNSRKL